MKNKGLKVKYDGLPVTWGSGDLFTHTLCIGPTRCGKSALVFQEIIMQTLVMKKYGIPIGLTVIEPKGDLARFAREVADELEIENVIHVDPLRPDSHKFNVMQGDMDIVAETTVTVLKGLFGKQEQFFALVQELSAKHVTKLLKTLAGDNFDIVDLVKTLRNENRMQERVAELRQKNPSDELIEFFDNELLGDNKDRYRQFVMGLRAQLENLISNKKLRNVLSGKSDINLDEHYEKGGILAVNTGLAELGASGDAFGQFIMMHCQRAVFRRGGTELTRIPHILIVDEASRYINAEVEVFLAIGAEYRVAGIYGLQSGGQLEVESGKIDGKAMRNAFLASCRNRIYFGGLAAEDAKAMSTEIGTEKRLMRQNTYKNNVLLPNLFPDSYRDTEVEEPIFSATDLRYHIPKFHFVYQFQQDGQPMPPRLAKGEFVPRNWKELRMWEQNENARIAPSLILKPLLKAKGKIENWRYQLIDRKKAWEYERNVTKALKRTTKTEGVDENESWGTIEEALVEMQEKNRVTDPHDTAEGVQNPYTDEVKVEEEEREMYLEEHPCVELTPITEDEWEALEYRPPYQEEEMNMLVDNEECVFENEKQSIQNVEDKESENSQRKKIHQPFF